MGEISLLSIGQLYPPHCWHGDCSTQEEVFRDTESGETRNNGRKISMAKRSEVLEFAVLGLLQDNPMHGYELRKRLNSVLGTFRAISYGSLYPCLKDLLRRDLIEEAGPADAGAPTLSGKRAKIVYQVTAQGKEYLADLLEDSGP